MLKSARDGQLTIDHRNSPGLPPGFMAEFGFPDVTQGRVVQMKTLTCCHCGTIQIMNPLRTRDRNHCKKCDAYVCDNPQCILHCTPFAKQMDDLEKLIIHQEAQASIFTGFQPLINKGP